MPVEIDFGKASVREVKRKDGCHSCILCKNCKPDFSEGYRYVCTVRKVNKNFPYDNTKCEDYGDYHYESKKR